MENKSKLKKDPMVNAKNVAAYRERIREKSAKLDTWIKISNKELLVQLSEEMNKPIKEIVDLVIEDYAKKRFANK